MSQTLSHNHKDAKDLPLLSEASWKKLNVFKNFMPFCKGIKTLFQVTYGIKTLYVYDLL